MTSPVPNDALIVGIFQTLSGLCLLGAAPLVFRATRLLGNPQWPWWLFSGAMVAVSLDRAGNGVRILLGEAPGMPVWRAAVYLGAGCAILVASRGFQYFLRAWYDDRERRFRRSVWSSLAEIYVLDPDSLEILDFNQGSEARLPRDVGRGAFTALLASSANDFQSALGPLREGEVDRVDVDAEFVAGDGSRPVEISVERNREEGRDVWVAFVKDAAERRRAEEEARRQEERFRQITESVEEAIVLADPQGLILYESPKAGPLLGFDPQVRVGRSILDGITEEDLAPTIERLTRLATGRAGTVEGQARFRRADDGRVVVLGYRARRVQFADEDPAILVSALDVTEQVEDEVRRSMAEERRRRREAAVVEISLSQEMREGDVRGVAAAAARALVLELPVARGSIWLGLGEGEAVECVALHTREGPGEPGSVLQARDYPRYFEALNAGRVIDARDAHTDGRTSEFSEGYLRPLGIGAILDATVRAGDVEGVVCAEHLGGSRNWTPEEISFASELADLVAIAVQESRRREADQDRVHMAAQLRAAQRMETLGVMAGGIAHDFNNLLTPILGYADMALAEVADEERDTCALAEIRTAGERAQALVRQLLTFSRKVESDRAPLDLSELVAEVLRLTRASLPSTIEIETELTPGLPLVEGDASQLHQVFLNLTANAGYAMREEGGRLQVRLDRAEVGERWNPDSLRLVPGSYARVTIRDEGVGMDQATKERVFEPFFTTKPQGEGTGLGLAVTHGIVLGHGGAIHLDSRRGEGTTVTVLLPLSEKTASLPAQPREAESFESSGQVVMVVDDEPAVARFTSRVLERSGCTVHTFTSALEAAGAVESGEVQPDLLVTDQTMPGLTGLALIERLRKRTPGLPVIVTSGYDAALNGAALDQAEIGAFLRKPFKGKDLVAAVRGLSG